MTTRPKPVTRCAAAPRPWFVDPDRARNPQRQRTNLLRFRYRLLDWTVPTRREFLKKSLAVGAVAAAGLGAFSLYEPHELEITRVDIPLRRLPADLDGFRIAQLSDLHFRPFTTEAEISGAVSAVNALQPDLVVLTGDFVSMATFGDARASAGHITTCAQLLTALRAAHGALAVLGNHDIGTDPMVVAGSLQEHRIPVLRNRAVPLEHKSAVLWIAGLDDGEYGLADIPRALAGVPAGMPVVLLAHEPDLADPVSRYAVDLQISGHSHGGQITVPLLGPPYLPRLGQKYWRGLYRVGNLQLYTNRGIGTIGLPMRFGSPPEVTLFTLRSRA